MKPKGFRDRILEKWRSIKDIAGEASARLLQLSGFLDWFLLACLVDQKERLGEEAEKKRPRSREEREKELDEIIYKLGFYVSLIKGSMEDIEKRAKDVISQMLSEDSLVLSTMNEKLFYIEDFCLRNIESELSEARSWLAKMESHEEFPSLCQKMGIDPQDFSDDLTSITQYYISPLFSVVYELKSLLSRIDSQQKVLESFAHLRHLLEHALPLSQLLEGQKNAALELLTDAAERFKRAIQKDEVNEAIKIYYGEISRLVDIVRTTVNDRSILSDLNEADRRLLNWLTELVYWGSAAVLFKFLLLRSVLGYLPSAAADSLPSGYR
jgi:hypothetical protein